MKVSEPQFEGQTKTKLGNTEVKSFVQKVCNEQLAPWFDANPAEAKAVARRRSMPRPRGWPRARRAIGPEPEAARAAAGCPASLPTADRTTP